jgi:hypothetical protein
MAEGEAGAPQWARRRWGRPAVGVLRSRVRERGRRRGRRCRGSRVEGGGHQRRWQWKGRSGHLNELNDTSGSSGRQLGGGRPWGRREAVSGKGLPVMSAMSGSRVGEGGRQQGRRCREAESREAARRRRISAAWRHTMWNPLVSRILVHGIMLYIGGTFFVSVILMWSALLIIGVGCPPINKPALVQRTMACVKEDIQQWRHGCLKSFLFDLNPIHLPPTPPLWIRCVAATL